jgi:glycosyltransferase 2 family protein
MSRVLANGETLVRMRGRMKKRLFSFLRFLLAVTLLFYLVQRIGLEDIRLVLSTVNPRYFAILYGLLAIDAMSRAYNWNILLQTKNYRLPLLEILYNYLVGGFLGTFIPSSLGTDVSRAFLTSRRNRVSMQDSVLAMLVLNLMGLLALCTIGFASAFLLARILNEATMVWPILLICLGYVILFPLMLHGWLPDSERLRLPQLEWVFARIREFSTALRAFKEHQAAMAKVASIALINQLLGIVIVYSVSLALRIDLPFHYFIAFVPIIVLSRLIPFSIAGLGGEQGVFVFLFAQVGVPYAEAFLVSLILSVMNINFTLLGGLVYTADSFYNLLRQQSRIGK